GADDLGEFGGGGSGGALVATFDHDADHGLRAGGTQHHSALAVHAFFDALHCLADGRHRGGIEAGRDLHVEQHLWELPHAGGELGEGPSGLLHDGEHLQSAHDAITGRGLVEAYDVAGGLAAEDAACLAQEAEHVAIADRRALEIDATLAQRHLQTEVAHHRADHRTSERAAAAARLRNDVEELIAIENAAEVIDHDEADAVAIQREAHVGPHARHGQLQEPGRRGAATVVDVAAVRRATDGDDLGTEVGEHPGTDFVGGAVGAIDDDLQSGEVNAARQRGGAEFLVLHARAVDAAGFPQAAGSTGDDGLGQLGLDALLELIRELRAAAIEELDAVVVVRIVRGADDDAEVTVEMARHIGDTRRRQRPYQHHVDAGSDEASLERRFEHVAGEPGVLADEDGTTPGHEHSRRSAREGQREVHGHGVLPHAAPDTISAEIFSRQ